LPMRHKDFSSSERGSLAPLGIGLALVCLATVTAVLASGSLYLTERRLTTLAEATALAVLIDSDVSAASDFSSSAKRFLDLASPPGLSEVVLIEASMADSRTVRVRLCSKWQSMFQSYIVSETGSVCSEGLARRGR